MLEERLPSQSRAFFDSALGLGNSVSTMRRHLRFVVVVPSTCASLIHIWSCAGWLVGHAVLVRKSEKVSCLQFRDVVCPALDKCCDAQAGFGPIHGQLGLDGMTMMPSVTAADSDFGPHMMQSLFHVTLFCKECDCVPFSWQILIINRRSHDKQRLRSRIFTKLPIFGTVESKLLCLHDHEVDGL